MDIGTIIQDRRKELGLTLKEVADLVGVSESTVSRWESGDIANMRRDRIKMLSETLKVSPMIIMGWEDSETVSSHRYYPELLEIGKATFPLFSGIACGEPLPMDEQIETYVSATTGIRADFVLRAVGTSMEPGIHDGDLVFIRSQPTVENGQVAAVAVDDSATLKRVFWYPDRDLLILKADNPGFGNLIYQDGELEKVRVLGLAVAFQRDVM